MGKKHVKTGKILAYVTNKLTEQEAIKVESHLAECSECAQRIRVYYHIRDYFDELWDSWTARQHAEELLTARIYSAINGKPLPSKVQKRINAWLKNFRQGFQTALNVVMDSSRQRARVAVENLKFFVQPEGSPVLEPIPAPLKILGEEEHPPVQVTVHGPQDLQVTVDPIAQKISVRMKLSEKESSPLILLIPKTEGEILISEFRHPEGTDYLLADFDDVLDGEYSLILGRTSFCETQKV